MQASNYKIFLLITLNISLQITSYLLIKLSWIYANHSAINIINYITAMALTVTFLRAYLWQHLLKMNDLVSSYLPNALIPSLLLLVGYFAFNEPVTLCNLIGTSIIVAGLALLFLCKRAI